LKHRNCWVSVLKAASARPIGMGSLDSTPDDSHTKEMGMLEIKNLHASVDGTEILRGIDLVVKAGEIHAIMGPNGSGKSTLSQVLAGNEAYDVTDGEILFKGQNLLELGPDERAVAGVFLAFQYPVEIPGVNSAYFLRTALNAIRRGNDLPEVDAVGFLTLLREKLKLVEMDEKFLSRPVNQGFSGGEKKRHEILQMAVLNPSLSILDETDSGLDIDALRIVSNGVNTLHGPDKASLVITHYQRLLDYIVPDFVHVILDGRIVQSGDKDLALTLEEKGYDWIKKEQPSRAAAV
jgi:Fe-S cluster assembly ATP-binding protein